MENLQLKEKLAESILKFTDEESVVCTERGDTDELLSRPLSFDSTAIVEFLLDLEDHSGITIPLEDMMPEDLASGATLFQFLLRVQRM